MMELARAPFSWDPSQRPDEAARDIIAAFERLAAGPGRVCLVFDTLMALLPLGQDHALVRAGRMLAARLDEGGWNGHPHAYHNVRHFCEVMLGSHFVALTQRLPGVETAEVILAAMMHDVAHDGGVNGDRPFRLERQSVDSVRPVVADAGLSDAQWQRLTALVLATDTMNGQPFAIACHRHHEDQSSPLPMAPEAAREMALLASDAMAARQALVLCEADVLPSAGLTPEYATAMQDKLAAEWNRSLGAPDKLRFIESWLDRSVASLYFKPNVDALRRRLLLDVIKVCR